MKNEDKFPKAPNEKLEKNSNLKYSENEDIYEKFNKEFDIDSENFSKKKHVKIINEDPEWDEKDLDQD